MKLFNRQHKRWDRRVRMDRRHALETWLAEVLPNSDFRLTTASADASFRRYFRVHRQDQTLIAMDAPSPQEDCRPFVIVAKLLQSAGLNVPQVLAQDISQGFLLLSDLGDTTYLSQLQAYLQSTSGDIGRAVAPCSRLYEDATSALVRLQQATCKDALPAYDAALLSREMQLFPDWYVAKHLGFSLSEADMSILAQTFALLNQNILAQTQVYVHRDYHSRNLMVCKDGSNPGILDFQDAVVGAITYDLVSLLKDAYIAWPEDVILDWAIRYWQKARDAGLQVPEDFAAFYRDFEWMGVQRHIKVLGIFARLYHRDGKDGYLNDMPLVLEYLYKACERYVELHPFYKLLQKFHRV